MSKKIVVAAMGAMFAVSAIAAGSVFSTLDTDYSGFISKDEAAAMPGLVDKWKELDADGSGDLSAKEFAAYESAEKPAVDAPKSAK